MEGDSNTAVANDMALPGNGFPSDDLMEARGLAFLRFQATGDLDFEHETNCDSEEDDQFDPILFTSETLLILEDVDVREHSRFVTPYGAETSAACEDLHRCKNGDSESLGALSHRIVCHTSNIGHHFCTWHGSKYCCRSMEPNRPVKCTIGEELFDDCLNYLECSDVMTDYTKGIWTSALLGNEPVFLLESDQDDETQASQDNQKEYDVLLSGVTYVNEGSDNAMDNLTSSCVTHSETSTLLEKDDFRDPEKEMVIVVDHSQDEAASLKRQGRCKVLSASSAVQEDQGETMKESRGDGRPGQIKHNPYMELYIVNVLGEAVAGMVTLKDESPPDSLLSNDSEDTHQWEEDITDPEYPGIADEMHRYLMEEHLGFSTEDSRRNDEEEDNEFLEKPSVSEEEGLFSDGTDSSAGDHSKLIQFLKENIHPPEVSGYSNDVPGQNQSDDNQEMEDTPKWVSEFKNQDWSNSLEKRRQSIEDFTSDLETVESTMHDFPIAVQNSNIVEEEIENDGDLSAIMESGLQAVDTTFNISETMSQGMDKSWLNQHEESVSKNDYGVNYCENLPELQKSHETFEMNNVKEHLFEPVVQECKTTDCESEIGDNEQSESISQIVDGTNMANDDSLLESPPGFQNKVVVWISETIDHELEIPDREEELVDGFSEQHRESINRNDACIENSELDTLNLQEFGKIPEQTHILGTTKIAVDSGLETATGFEGVSQYLDSHVTFVEGGCLNDNSENQDISRVVLPIPCQVSEIHDIIENESTMKAFEIQDSGLQAENSKPTCLDGVSENGADPLRIIKHTEPKKEVDNDGTNNACIAKLPKHLTEAETNGYIKTDENIDKSEIADRGTQNSDSESSVGGSLSQTSVLPVMRSDSDSCQKFLDEFFSVECGENLTDAKQISNDDMIYPNYECVEVNKAMEDNTETMFDQKSRGFDKNIDELSCSYEACEEHAISISNVMEDRKVSIDNQRDQPSRGFENINDKVPYSNNECEEPSMSINHAVDCTPDQHGQPSIEFGCINYSMPYSNKACVEPIMSINIAMEDRPLNSDDQYSKSSTESGNKNDDILYSNKDHEDTTMSINNAMESRPVNNGDGCGQPSRGFGNENDDLPYSNKEQQELSVSMDNVMEDRSVNIDDGCSQTSRAFGNKKDDMPSSNKEQDEPIMSMENVIEERSVKIDEGCGQPSRGFGKQNDDMPYSNNECQEPIISVDNVMEDRPISIHDQCSQPSNGFGKQNDDVPYSTKECQEPAMSINNAMEDRPVNFADCCTQPSRGFGHNTDEMPYSNKECQEPVMSINSAMEDRPVNFAGGCNQPSRGFDYKTDDMPYSNKECQEPSTQINNAMEDRPVCDQPSEGLSILDKPRMPDMLDDTNICLAARKASRRLMVDRSLSFDDSLAINSIKNISGKLIKLNASEGQEEDKMHIKKKAIGNPSLNRLCFSIRKGDHEIINKVLVENYQGAIAEKCCCSGNTERVSPAKTKAAMTNNSTEIEKAHSLHVKDYIPNSQELSQVCRDPDTIRGIQLVRAQSVDLDQTRGASCSLRFTGSTNFCEKCSDSKMVKKKFKSAEKATKNTENEDKSLDVNEIFPPEEEKRIKRQTSIGSKDSKKAPRLLQGIQAEMFPDRSGNLKLFCHFGEIHADSTVTWTKDSKLLARMHRSPKDDSPVSLAIVQTSKKDQGQYQCTLKNMHGKVLTEFHLTAEVLEELTHYQDFEGGEAIEFNQLLFREDFITDMYFGGNLQGRIATEELHFGEGVHRKAFRSKVMCGLLPVFNPGHLCVLKVHNAIAYGTKTNDELVEKNYKLAVQECYVQNTAREYAKIYATEAEQLEDFGKVPEIIPIFLIHRPANNIPYATVEEELIGDFVKYSIKDGKEINVLRKDSEAGQKCCTFQHWVYERTGGNLLVTDMQGVGMRLTDVGIATMGKGYKGFKGNCSVSFIDQFKALHQCNKYCEILGLQPLKPNNSKPKKAASTKEKPQPKPSTTTSGISTLKSRNSIKAKKT